MMEKKMHYVVKVNSKVTINCFIPAIKEFPSIREITLDYQESGRRLVVKILDSKKGNDINYSKLISSITNHANAGEYEVSISVEYESKLRRLFSRPILSLDMDYLGCIKSLESDKLIKNKQLV